MPLFPRGEFVSALPQSVIPLRRNLRNTRRIHAVMSKWYEGKRSTPAGPEGKPVAIHECKGALAVFAAERAFRTGLGRELINDRRIQKI